MREDLKIYEINQSELAKFKFAVIKTEKGDMNLELFGDEAPQAVTNFAALANDGFYKGLNFHRVIPNFVIHCIGRGRLRSSSRMRSASSSSPCMTAYSSNKLGAPKRPREGGSLDRLNRTCPPSCPP